MDVPPDRSGHRRKRQYYVSPFCSSCLATDDVESEGEVEEARERRELSDDQFHRPGEKKILEKGGAAETNMFNGISRESSQKSRL